MATGEPEIYLRGEGGATFAFALPLSVTIKQRYERGELVRVNPDGTPWREPASEPVPQSQDNPETENEKPESTDDGDTSPKVAEPPAKSASKAEWVAYAVQVGGLQPDEADGLTVAELRERFSTQ